MEGMLVLMALEPSSPKMRRLRPEALKLCKALSLQEMVRARARRTQEHSPHPLQAKGSKLYALQTIRLMDKILHELKDSKLWELWYIPYNG